MKTKIIVLAFLILFPFYSYCQNLQNLKGSWMGTVATSDFSMQIIFRFEVRNDILKGFLDSPDEGFIDIPIDKIWNKQDSIFTDLESATVFKGLMLPGDSVIEGYWGGIPLRLSRTQFVFTPGSNLNPKLAGHKIIKLIESTPIKDQQATGLCWSYATTSFIETEAMRLGKHPVVLSPMFYVVPTYVDKAEKYIRMNGKSYFDQGDLTFSVLKAYKQYGAIPEKIYPGKMDSTLKHYHGDMAKALTEKVNYFVKKGRGKMTNSGYRNETEEIVTKELGKIPANFIYQGKSYTPKSFASERIAINPDDYFEVTSFSHHPFYSKFILEIESNWNNNYYLNLPLDDFTKLIDNALLNNYSVCWDGDIHEGYNTGFAVLNDTVKNITQQDRQNAFDNFTTQDVHNMHIIGIAENEKGNRFYIIKNSSAFLNCGGYLYMSKEFLLLKTISVMVHKDVLPDEYKTSESKSTVQPGETVFSRFHTLSIHIKDPAVHDSVFHFLKDKLQLPVYYNPETIGERKYAGIFAGNLVLEPCGPYKQFNYVTDFKAIFFGLNFETDNSISSVAKVLENLNMKHEIHGDEYIYLRDNEVSGENSFIGIYNRHEKEKDHAKLDSLRSVMTSNIESDLGIEYVNEIQVGYPGDKNLERWKQLIYPSELDKDQVWHVANGLNIRFMPDNIKEVKGITFKVKSLLNAKAYLKEKGLLGTENNGTIAIDPKKSFGLSICFTE